MLLSFSISVSAFSFQMIHRLFNISNCLVILKPVYINAMVLHFPCIQGTKYQYCLLCQCIIMNGLFEPHLCELFSTRFTILHNLFRNLFKDICSFLSLSLKGLMGLHPNHLCLRVLNEKFSHPLQPAIGAMSPMRKVS